MKHALTFVIVLMFCLNAIGQVIDEYKLGSEYKGAIKSIKQYSVRYKEQNDVDTLRWSKEYGRNGNLLIATKDRHGPVSKRYVYDANGHLAEVWRRDEGLEMMYHKVICDKDGHLSEVLTYSMAGSILKRDRYRYNKQGLLSEEMRTSPDFDSSELVFAYEYNEKGQKVRTAVYAGGDTTYAYYRFNIKGNMIQEVFYDRYGRPGEACSMTYSSDGSEISSVHASSSGHVSKKETRYEHPDLHGNYKTRTCFNNGKLSSADHYVFEYY